MDCLSVWRVPGFTAGLNRGEVRYCRFDGQLLGGFSALGMTLRIKYLYRSCLYMACPDVKANPDCTAADPAGWVLHPRIAYYIVEWQKDSSRKVVTGS